MQTFFNCYVILNVIEFHMPVKKSPLMLLNQRHPIAQLTVQYWFKFWNCNINIYTINCKTCQQLNAAPSVTLSTDNKSYNTNC